MKDKLIIIIRSLAILLALTLLFSLIFSALYFFHVISQNMFHILNWIFGAISFFIAGIVLGAGIVKKALLHAFVIVIILALLGLFMMDSFAILAIVEFVSKLFLYVCGSVFALNMKIKT